MSETPDDSWTVIRNNGVTIVMLNVHLLPSSGQALASPASESSSADQAPPLLGTAEPSGVSPPLALRCDGAVLLSIEELGDADLTGLPIWTAVVLPADQAEFAHGRVMNAAQETAAHLAGRLPKKNGSDAS